MSVIPDATATNQGMVLGDRIKKRRTELGFSLRDVAEMTGLTPSFLSQLERSVTNSSLRSLQKISDALNVPMLYFLSDDSERSPVVRAGNRSTLDLNDDRVVYELLSHGLSGKMEALMGHINCGVENIARPLSVETEEFIYVLEGVLVVGLKEQEYTLNAGDSIYFNGRDLVKLTCGAVGETRWISVITPLVF